MGLTSARPTFAELFTRHSGVATRTTNRYVILKNPYSLINSSAVKCSPKPSYHATTSL
ncbi:hypothetical protein SAMN05216357_103136 [Porphyromonadaceae bacterium KH3CP3RA]|nr:hypothetical protein SAMN05216357_103136 [Porphyromonadaceae bacterium KH3CP3RA]